jgi:hypothetical protein
MYPTLVRKGGELLSFVSSLEAQEALPTKRSHPNLGFLPRFVAEPRSLGSSHADVGLPGA